MENGNDNNGTWCNGVICKQMFVQCSIFKEKVFNLPTTSIRDAKI